MMPVDSGMRFIHPARGPSPRRLVLHADDFGMNPNVNRGIIEGFSDGLLTSTSLLANAPGAESAVTDWKRLLRDRENGHLASVESRRRVHDPDIEFDLGVHLNLTQGRPLTGVHYPAELLDTEGRFPGVFGLLRRLIGMRSSSKKAFRAAIAGELHMQTQFLCDCSIAPTHVNGHQYVEMLPVISTLIPALLQKFNIPVVRLAQEGRLAQTTLLRGEMANWCLSRVKRFFATRFQTQLGHLGIPHTQAFFGTAHAGRIDMSLMREFVSGAARQGLTEIGVHPAAAEAESTAAMNSASLKDGWNDPLSPMRPLELALLKSPELVEFLESRRIGLGRLSELSIRSPGTQPHIGTSIFQTQS